MQYFFVKRLKNNFKKMSITCTDIEDSELTRKASYKFTNKFVHVTSTLPSECTQFEPNYKFRKIFLPANFKTMADDILNLQVRKDDIWIITYPKSGTTLMSDIVWLLKNNLDFETNNKIRLNERVLYLESKLIFNDGYDEQAAILINELNRRLDVVNTAKSPRIIKSHLHVNLLPKQIWTVKPKIIYVSRNVKDVAVSWYHHFRNIQGYEGDFNDFMDAFLAHHIIYAPYHDHVQNYLKLKNEENVFFTTYEEIQADSFDVVKRVSEFFGENYSDEQLKRLCEHVSFDKMKLNPGINWERDLSLLKSYFRFQPPDTNFW